MRKDQQEKFAKLPKWAQSEIQVLRANLESAKRQLAEATGETDVKSEVRVSGGVAESKGTFRYLPKGTRIAFTLDGGDEITFDMRRENGRCFVRAAVTGGRWSSHIAVTGESGNVLNISTSRERGVADE